MGYGISPTIGEPVTCDGPCTHTDCAATRAMVAALCPYCGKPLGQNVRYYHTDDGPAHALCVIDRVAMETATKEPTR